MIKSMTGFGRCELSNEKRKITVELKSVNHRYLDINIRMPKKLNFFEAAIRSLLKEYMQRGKVDVFISYEDFSEQTMAVKYNSAIAKEYLSYLQQMAEEFKARNGSLICRQLLGLNAEKDDYHPEKRTESYYASRPCAKLVKDAAEIAEQMLLTEASR